MRNSSYKSGFITIIGSPNVGKSTLMNLMVGQKISIVSERAQTTRNRIAGVVTRKGYQIVFLDTPGVTGAKNRLGEFMLRVAYESLKDVECILFMLDASKGIREMDEALIENLRRRAGGTPVIAAINKTDLATFDDIETIRERLEGEEFIKRILPISAETGRNVDELEKILAGYLVEGPQYYPDDMVTDQPVRVITAEIIREKALKSLRQEIPHGIGVDIERITLREDGINDVNAVIYCERDSHKGIIIGRNGAMLKRIGSAARPEIETLFGTKVNLQLWVKVRPDWRNSANALRELGYNED
ncbi:MAG: GTPase Era [Clostridia bacterium]|nr:GTPase Era [Clostridia bacterium]MBR5717897.1 GTPase Era [Clostridia bacterium]